MTATEARDWRKLLRKLGDAFATGGLSLIDESPEPPRVYEDTRGVFVYLCDLCGQVLGGPNDECNSSLHVGPSGHTRGKAVASIGRIYTQADLDFFSDNADEYFRMANEQRQRAEAVQRERDHLAITLANVQVSGGVPDYVHRNIEATLGDLEGHIHEVEELADRVATLTQQLEAERAKQKDLPAFGTQIRFAIDTVRDWWHRRGQAHGD